MYRTLFYDEVEVKHIPTNIGELLTPIGLAYWFADFFSKDMFISSTLEQFKSKYRKYAAILKGVLPKGVKRPGPKSKGKYCRL